MSALDDVLQIFRRGIDDAALAFAAAFGAVRRPRRITLAEQPEGEFLLCEQSKAAAPERLRFEDGDWIDAGAKSATARLAGAQIELLLASRRFLFRDLELPRRAGEFLDGVVRAQIDRLTPWKPQEAVFGWSDPVELSQDRISVTVAATPRASIAEMLDALEAAHVKSLIVATPLDGEPAGARQINVVAERGGSARQLRRWRPILVGALAVAAFAAVASGAAAVFLGGDLDVQADALQRQIAVRRAALANGRGSASDKAVAALNARKRATPAGVLVLEALSRTLPDSAYLTQFHLEGGKVEIAGLAEDPPQLIRAIEQSTYFKHAAFNAPTTKTANERGERFHIEALAEPVFAFEATP